MQPTRRRPLRLLRQADLSRLWHKSRSTICALYAGRLAAAVVNGRVNYDHPEVVQYMEERGLGGDNLLAGRQRSERPPEEPRPLVIHDDAVSPAEFAAMAGRTEAEVEAAMRPGGELRQAVIPAHHLSAESFAFVAGVETSEIIEAAKRELAPAVTPSGRLDLGHRAALRYLSAHPFKRDATGAVVESDIPQGMLQPAILDAEHLDADSPFYKAFGARCGDAA